MTPSLVFLLLFVWLAEFAFIDFSSRSRVFLGLLTSTPLALFFFLFLGLVRVLSIFGMVKRYYFLNLGLKFFNFRVFYKTVLVLSGDEIGWLDISRIMLVCLASSRARPKWFFGLNVNCFLYQLLEAVQFMTTLLYFGSNRKF